MIFLKKVINKCISFYYYISNNSFMMATNMKRVKFEKKIYIYTLAWGNYIDWYFNFTLPALMHDSNTKALENSGYEVKFILYTIGNGKDKDVIDKYIDENDYFRNIKVVELDIGQRTETKNIAVLAVLDVFKRCIKERALLFLAPPDCIFGNGSLYNSVIASYDKKKCFASALPRVSLDILNEIGSYPKQGITNSELVSLCMKFPHDNFKYANEELDINTTHKGVSYRKISTGLYTVTHNLPSAFLVFPIKEDYDYFNKVQDFNMWDRGWLDLLIRTKRIKISGSSDLFFLVELTPAPFERESELKKDLKHNDEVPRPEFHHYASNMFISVWRTHD